MVILITVSACSNDDCTVQAQVMQVSTSRTASGFIEICHNNDDGTTQTITINENAWAGHESHGDTKGKCSTLSDNNITAEAGDIVDLPCDFDFEGQKISNGKYYVKI